MFAKVRVESIESINIPFNQYPKKHIEEKNSEIDSCKILQ
jgi:hypothetical protein